jgi:hypothetical protein
MNETADVASWPVPANAGDQPHVGFQGVERKCW